MLKFVKFLVLAFVGQLAINGVLIILLELTGIAAFGWIPLLFYFFASDRIYFHWTGNVHDAGDWRSTVSTALPIIAYSIFIASALMIWRKFSRKPHNSSQLS